VTETDLITAGGSSENDQLPSPVNSDISTPAAEEASNSTPTAETAPTADVASGNRAGSLSTMVLPELRALAKQIGVEGASGMRKSDLVAAIRERRGESNGTTAKAADAAPAEPAAETATASETTTEAGEQTEQQRPRRERRGASRGSGAPSGSDQSAQGRQDAKQDTAEQPAKQRDKSESDKSDGGRSDGDKADGGDQQGGQQNRNQNRNNQNNQNNQNDNDDDGEGRGGRRGRRFRDRRRRERGGEGGGGQDRDTELREDDVVQPVAGILDVLDNYAFVRTSGYLAGPNDVYVSMNMVRKNGLRRGDAVTGAVRVPKEGEGGGQNPRQKFNPLVRLDTVNGGPVEDAKNRDEFTKLTPLYPNQRLRLETTSEKLTTRLIDLIMPIGKGQRALIVSPPKAGKTTIMQDIANAITKNNPECHLMVVLVDERPEEVTDMQRSVKGEVIASTFRRQTTLRLPSSRSSAPSGSSSRARMSSCCSTRSPDWAAPTTTRRRPRAGSCPVVSTRPRCIRPSGSSVRPATSSSVVL
jgi:transcription termination factor Rho